MQSTSHLWVFFGIVFGVVILPGLDMAMVLGSALVGGRRSGLSATAGIVAGGLCHVGVGAAGLAAVIALVPSAFNALLLAGALYMAWVGVALWRSGMTPVAASNGPAQEGAEKAALAASFRRGMLTNLTNPKAYVFMLAIFPQFLHPEAGSLGWQLAPLALITACTQASVYGTIAWLAAHVRELLTTRPAAALGVARVVGASLILAAIFTGVEGWQRM